MPWCRRRSGAATGSRQRPHRRHRADGVAHPPLPSLPTQAAAEQKAGATIQGVIGILDSDPGDALAMALARLGRAVQIGNPQ